MLFSELYKMMINKFTFVRFRGANRPPGSTPVEKVVGLIALPVMISMKATCTSFTSTLANALFCKRRGNQPNSVVKNWRHSLDLFCVALMPIHSLLVDVNCNFLNHRSVVWRNKYTVFLWCSKYCHTLQYMQLNHPSFRCIVILYILV